ncbi:DDE Tnp4 domain-containing protein [Mycena indigotica]|uniref:DDE Tnp4 domain-containing protein n=1 Tax=Mycena indigotica TaxID=2126181 RepID=A0A8H6VT74_9AGAR|nr:DDE Tnp4 domain-containing protein [Mycena indigotica]KAF7293087.1 DDE Tnp4 domain-containing protein [Mycena indigotica]
MLSRQRLRMRRHRRFWALGLSRACLQNLTRLSLGLPRRACPSPLDLADISDDSSSDGSSSESESESSNSSVDSFELRHDSLHIPRRQRRVPPASSRVLSWVQHQIDEMYSQRYNVPRNRLERPRESTMETCLKKWKHRDKIEGHPIFTNNSNNGQTPVEIQLAVALYQFGHDGNGASLQAVSWWSGLGKGTIPRCTRRVITAILGSGMLAKYVRMPTTAEKADAKAWVEKTSGCREWGNGWCMVDGTLIPLASRPNGFGPSYFDRKMNYSMNLQVVNLPNLQIIDIGYGYVGSTHNATAWTGTRVYRELSTLLLEGEFIWGDAAYPLSRWLSAPIKGPEKETPDNTTFNNHVSYVRVKSEHCIGFVKGRLQSLKGLRLTINNEADHIYATQWIMACVVVHNFALLHEAKLRAKRPTNPNYTSAENDPFIPAHIRNRQQANTESAHQLELETTAAGNRARLAAGKAKRNQLKSYLLASLHTRRQQLGYN